MYTSALFHIFGIEGAKVVVATISNHLWRKKDMTTKAKKAEKGMYHMYAFQQQRFTFHWHRNCLGWLTTAFWLSMSKREKKLVTIKGNILVKCKIILTLILYSTDLGSLIGNTLCGNFLGFVCHSILVILKPQNCHFDHISSSEFWIFTNFEHFQVWNFFKNQNSKPQKLLKRQFWPSEISLSWFHAKLNRVEGKLLNFQCGMSKFKNSN